MLEVERINHQGLGQQISVSHPDFLFQTFRTFLRFDFMYFQHAPHGAAVEVDQHPLVWIHIETLSILNLKMATVIILMKMSTVLNLKIST